MTKRTVEQWLVVTLTSRWTKSYDASICTNENLVIGGGIVSTKRAIIIILLAMAASVLIMESGVYSLKLDGSGGSGSTLHYAEMDPGSVKAGSFIETESGYRVFIQNSQGEEQAADVVIEIDDMSIDGCYWLPLYKRVDCRYSGRAVCSDNLVEITFDGHFEDFAITGLCSPLAARRLAREKAMDEIETIVEYNLGLMTSPVSQASSAQEAAVSR